MSKRVKRIDGAALVTGAGSENVGRATAIALAIAGIDTLYITDLNEAGLQETHRILESLPLGDGQPRPTIIAKIGDIACPLFVSNFFEDIPRLDYAVNCAGIEGYNKRTTETSLAEFDNVTDINYRAIHMCMKEELKLMLQNDVKPYNGVGLSEHDAQTRGQRGSIVNIASQQGLVGLSRAAAYGAVNAAVCSLGRSDAIDYSDPTHRIRINAICPGVIRSAATTDLQTGEPLSERIKNMVAVAPMGRMGLPSEVADAAVFLCSGESSFMTGASMVLDGGYTVT